MTCRAILTWLASIPVAIAYGTATNSGYCAAYVIGCLVLLLPAATVLNHEQDARDERR